jgi:hypothetical protein
MRSIGGTCGVLPGGSAAVGSSPHLAGCGERRCSAVVRGGSEFQVSSTTRPPPPPIWEGASSGAGSGRGWVGSLVPTARCPCVVGAVADVGAMWCVTVSASVARASWRSSAPAGGFGACGGVPALGGAGDASASVDELAVPVDGAVVLVQTPTALGAAIDGLRREGCDFGGCAVAGAAEPLVVAFADGGGAGRVVLATAWAVERVFVGSAGGHLVPLASGCRAPVRLHQRDVHRAVPLERPTRGSGAALLLVTVADGVPLASRAGSYAAGSSDEEGVR